MSHSNSTVQHLALHLAKDAGLLAAAAEKLDHPNESKEGQCLLDDWMLRRAPHVEKTIALLRERAKAEASG